MHVFQRHWQQVPPLRARLETSRKRTVVLIGRTDGGKSSCANVIAGICDLEQRPLFAQSSASTSDTKRIDAQTVTVDWRGQDYSLKIVDTIGIGDTELPHDEVLKSLALVCHECREGINALFFVVKGRFTDEDANTWDLVWKVIFDSQIIEHTTLIRSQFEDFLNPQKVANDVAKLKQDRPGRRVEQSMRKIIHVDNPSLSYGATAKYAREQSRKSLMDEIVLADRVYKPARLNEVNCRVGGYITALSAAQQKIEHLEEKMKSSDKARDEVEKLRIRTAVAEAEKKIAGEMIEMLQDRLLEIEKSTRRRCPLL